MINITPTTKRVRAFFAPVNRATNTPTLFNAAQDAAFPLSTPPAPWVDLGWISHFTRTCSTTIEPILAGAPAFPATQTRTAVEATVHLRFEQWGKLQLALSAGSQQLNLLQPTTALALLPGSTATTLQLSPTDAATLAVGQLLAIDTDYTGTIGFLGAGVSGAYAKTALTDPDYTRRITLNVARILTIQDGTVTLDTPLLAGTPTTGMKAAPLTGFYDREGSSFFQEWSALFLAEGQQGERILWHYPRLQSTTGATEDITATTGGYNTQSLAATFRALPITDPLDNERIVCLRTYLPA